MTLKPMLQPTRNPVTISGGFGTKNNPALTPPGTVGNPSSPTIPTSPKPSGGGFGIGIDGKPLKPPTAPQQSTNAAREALEIQFGKEAAKVEKITKSTNPRGLENLGKFGDEITEGVGKAVGSSLDDFGRIIGRAGGVLGKLSGVLGAASLGADIANFANTIDPAGKRFLDDFNWQTGKPNTISTPQETSGVIHMPIPPSWKNPTQSPAQTSTPTREGVPIGDPVRNPIQSPTQSPSGTPSPSRSPSQSPGGSPSSTPTPNPFKPPSVESPGKSPNGTPLSKGKGGVNLNKPIWEKLNELEESKEPDLEPIVKAVVGVGQAIITGVGGLIAPAVSGVIFTSHLTSQVVNLIKGLTLSTSFSIPQALSTTALIPSTLSSTALLPKTLSSTALLPKTLSSTALLPKTLSSTALLPSVLNTSATIPQKISTSSVINQLLEGSFQLPNQELEMDVNLGTKNINLELDFGEREIEINIPQGDSSIELDVNLNPLKNELKQEIKNESEKCRKQHNDHCKKTGDDVKKIREKLEIEFPEIAGEGEIVCKDVVTPYRYAGKGLLGLQQMINIQMGITKNILSHVCNGLKQQEILLTGEMNYATCTKNDDGELVIVEQRYEGVGLAGIQQQINSLANLNRYIITEVCKHGNLPYPVFADPQFEEFPVPRQLTFTLVESRFYPYQEGSHWHMTIPNPRPNLTWDDFEQFRFWKGEVFGKIVWENSKIWSGGYFRDADEARRILIMMESLSTAKKSGNFRISTGGKPRKPEVREVRAVRAVIAELSPVTGDPETVLTYVPPTR